MIDRYEVFGDAAFQGPPNYGDCYWNRMMDEQRVADMDAQAKAESEKETT